MSNTIRRLAAITALTIAGATGVTTIAAGEVERMPEQRAERLAEIDGVTR